jgi:hypothetical protein
MVACMYSPLACTWPSAQSARPFGVAAQLVRYKTGSLDSISRVSRISSESLPNTSSFPLLMCFAEDSVEYATATCAMCAVMREVYNKPHTLCPHVPAMGVCRNRTNHPKADMVYYRNAEIKTYNGCGYCKVYFTFYFYYRYTRVDRMHA